MRVNVEDDLWTSGRLSKLARTMKWDERQALGALVMFWRATQQAEIISAPRDRLITECVLYFDSDEQAGGFVDAMTAAKLIERDGELLRVRGNAPHVERVQKLRATASAAGTASAKKRNDFVTVTEPLLNHDRTTTEPSLNAPSSLLPSPSKKFASPSAPRKPKPHSDTHRIRTAFEQAYEEKHSAKYLNWDGAHGKFAKHLADTGQADRVIQLLPAYFALSVTHTFFEGFDSFKAKLNQLHTKHSNRTSQRLSFDEQMRRVEEQARREEAI